MDEANSPIRQSESANIDLHKLQSDGPPIGFLVFTVIYFASPIDLVPDIPLVGYVDDLSLLLMAGFKTVTYALESVQVELERSAAPLGRVIDEVQKMRDSFKTVIRWCKLMFITAVVLCLGFVAVLCFFLVKVLFGLWSGDEAALRPPTITHACVATWEKPGRVCHE